METSSWRTLRGPSRSSQSQVNSRPRLSAVPDRARGCSCTIAVGTHAESDWAAHAGTSQTAVSVGDFVQVLLVVGLCVIERASGRDLRGDRPVTGTPKRLLVGVASLLCSQALLVACVVDCRAVLRAYVVALTYPLRRVMGLPEHREQIPIGDLLRIEDDEHGLGVPGSSAANLLVGRVWGKASRVADRCRVNAVDLPEFTLGPPEAAETKDRGARTLGKGWLEERAEHGVLLGNGERRLVPAGKSLGGHDHLGLVAAKEHSLTSSPLSSLAQSPSYSAILYRSSLPPCLRLPDAAL